MSEGMTNGTPDSRPASIWRQGLAPKAVRIITWGGLGDMILMTPCFRAIKTASPRTRVKVYWLKAEHAEAFRHNPYVDVLKPARFTAAPLEFVRYTFRKAEYVVPRYGPYHPSLFPTKHATQALGEMMGIAVTDLKPDIFLTHGEDAWARAFIARYRMPVGIHITSRTSANSQWPVASWETLLRRTPECTFLQFGLADEPPVAGAVDLRGRTTIRQAFALVRHLAALVGVDSVMQHAAAAFGTPGVVLYGPATPLVWGHPTSMALVTDLICSPCLDILQHAPCPYGAPCMPGIAPATVSAALRQQLAHARGA